MNIYIYNLILENTYLQKINYCQNVSNESFIYELNAQPLRQDKRQVSRSHSIIKIAMLLQALPSYSCYTVRIKTLLMDCFMLTSSISNLEVGQRGGGRDRSLTMTKFSKFTNIYLIFPLNPDKTQMQNWLIGIRVSYFKHPLLVRTLPQKCRPA